MKRTILIYTGLLVFFGLVICLTLEWGQLSLQPNPVNQATAVADPGASTSSISNVSPWATLREKVEAPLGRLLLQFIVILGATQIVGAIFRKIRQPGVIGAMTAGILLGPSLFGWLWPGAFNFVFADSSLQTLRLFSQIGVCLFMFVVGMELELGHIRQNAHTAVVVSQASEDDQNVTQRRSRSRVQQRLELSP